MTDYLSEEEREELAADELKRQQLRRENELNDLRLICETEHGRRFIWRLIEQAGVWRTTYTGEALSAAFAEGKRNTGLKVFSDVMEACPDQYLAMGQRGQRGIAMNLFERLMYRRLCNEQPADGGAAPAASEPSPDSCG
ncbi:Uncharacterised protein [Klebsiella pneumoniae subsp. ozaenae]|uniref:Bbp19-like phage domain-containing protein n=5 Tax=Enterobacterales TaxID=91347 RepID=A0A377ZBI9_KLEPO|nr:Uncharacterised protein [Klebsiella pneumoniae subsp. ozaenae]